jgi:hypothetical protein
LSAKIVLILLSSLLISGIVQTARSEVINAIKTPADTASIPNANTADHKPDNLKSLKMALQSGKPTLAFFYYSVACSCTAARCAIAASAIDSIPTLTDSNDSLNFIKIDAYIESDVETPYNLMIMPAIVYYDNSGKEINRLEWGTSRAAIKMLFEHPEIIQEPLD